MKQLINLLLGVLLVSGVSGMIGCNDKPSDITFPDVTAKFDTIYGTVKYKVVDTTGTRLLDWNFGPAMVRATVDGDNFATAAITSDGNFTLVLPETIAGKYFISMLEYAQTLGGSIITSPESLHFIGPVAFRVDYTENGEAKNMPVNLATYKLVNNKPIVDRVYSYNFYDQDGSFKGTSYYGNEVSWIFTKGWGMVEAYVTSNANATTASKSINTAPSDAIWTN